MQKVDGKCTITSVVLGLLIFAGWFQTLEAQENETITATDNLLRARQAPFCIDETNTSPVEKGLERFLPMFTYHDGNKYITTSRDHSSPTGMLKNIGFTHIHVNDKDSGYQSLLHNWYHITIESHVFLEGLYIQAVSAPWGIPFGEFLVSFDCGDCASKTSVLKNYTHIIPCIHRGAVSHNHPNVLTIGGEKTNKKIKFKQAHFHFRFPQYPCFDHTYAQFLIIAVRNFDEALPRFETFWSRIFELRIAQNVAGAYYPFYYGWKTNFLKCHTGTETMKDFELMPPEGDFEQKRKLMVNGEFDNCVVKKEGKEWYTCPPGPVKFSNSPNTLNEWNAFRSLFQTNTSNNGKAGQTQVCYDAGEWDWNVGQAAWTVPSGLVWANGSVRPDIPLSEDNLNETCHLVNNTDGLGVPDDFKGEVVICEIEVKPEVCEDPHASDCDGDKIVPTYGKVSGNRTETFDWDNATFSQQFDEIAWRWGKKHVLRFHGQLLIFAWVVAFNILAYIGRYLKEDTVIDKKSSYIGIGDWIWYHMMVSYLFIGTAGAGLYLVSNHHTSIKNGVKGSHDLCNVHSYQIQTEACLMSEVHKYFGYASGIGLGLSYFSGWSRSRSVSLRKGEVFFHIGGAYFGKVVGLLTIIITPNGLPVPTIVYIVLMEFCSILMFVGAALMTQLADKRIELETRRKWFPIPEAIDTFSQPPYKFIRGKVLPVVHIVIQLLLFSIMLIHF
ncbi:hypothetical protein Ocin01_04041 [Orchesella cincta]|uniref:Uncharacterized protein n=1 Tax=Orchesella cincta TaxID=48709 RepID=A0A1D2NBK6_ORCCI|nr:hypothetical protein Ocin01_04041 [Orchesella cincta]